jgi:hypothetical protein
MSSVVLPTHGENQMPARTFPHVTLTRGEWRKICEVEGIKITDESYELLDCLHLDGLTSAERIFIIKKAVQQ